MKAIAILKGDNDLCGNVVIEQEMNQVACVTATIYNLPKGKHGFHVHEFGDLSNGCTSAGSHYNPFNKRHGGPMSSERHVGDMGNIESLGEDKTIFVIYDHSIQLMGEYSVIGRSIVLHENEDDLGLGLFEDSLTTGHSGARLACGVIGIAAS